MADHLGIGMTMLDVVHDVPDLGGSTVILAWWIIDISRHHQPAGPQAALATLTMPNEALGAWGFVAEQRRLPDHGWHYRPYSTYKATLLLNPVPKHQALGGSQIQI